MTKILVIDSNSERGQHLAESLEQLALTATFANTLPDVIQNVDCLVATSALVHEKLSTLTARVPVVVIAEQGTIPDAVAAIHRGAEDYLALPLEPEHLVALASCLQSWWYQCAVAHLQR